MKILRNIGKIFGSGIFVLALSMAIFTFGLIKLTEHDKLKVLAIDLIDKQLSGSIDKDMIAQMHSMFLEECEKSQEIQLSGLAGQNATVKCEDIKKTTPENLISVIGGAMFDDVYYKKYDCSFIKCLQKTGQEKYAIFLSLNAHSFFKNLQNILLVAGGIGIGMMLVLIEMWENRLKSIGMILVSTSLPLLVMILLKDKILPVSSDMMAVALPIINQMFGSMLNVLIGMAIVGIVLIAGGYLLRHNKTARTGKKYRS